MLINFKTIEEVAAAGFPTQLDGEDLTLDEANFMAKLIAKLKKDGVKNPQAAAQKILANGGLSAVKRALRRPRQSAPSAAPAGGGGKDGRGPIPGLSEDEPSGMATVDIRNVEIFQAGTHKSIPFDSETLDRLVQDTNKNLDALKPFVKLGHNEDQPYTDGQPSMGWLYNLRRVGDKVVTDIKGVPKALARVIGHGGYRRVSVELMRDRSMNGEQYPYLLRALAFLGANVPEVKTLADLPKLYYADTSDSDSFWGNYATNDTQHWWGQATDNTGQSWTTGGWIWYDDSGNIIKPLDITLDFDQEEEEVTKEEAKALLEENEALKLKMAEGRASEIREKAVAFADSLLEENKIKADDKDKWVKVLVHMSESCDTIEFAEGDEPFDKTLMDLLTSVAKMAENDEQAEIDAEKTDTDKDEERAAEMMEDYKSRNPGPHTLT